MLESSCCPRFFFSFFFFNIYVFIIIIILAMVGLGCCKQAFSRCGKQGLLFTVVCGLLFTVTSLVEHRLQAHGLQWLAQ